MIRGTFPVVVFVARAASGKSESLTFIKAMPPEERERLLHIGQELVILDDYPYVHLMRRIDEELIKLGQPPLFFVNLQKGFLEPQINWKLLVMLLNQDYHQLVVRRELVHTDNDSIVSAVGNILSRMDQGRKQLGSRPIFFTPDGHPMLGQNQYKELVISLARDAVNIVEMRNLQIPKDPENTTTLIEFARGGEYGAEPPLPYGYADSFSALDPNILRKGSFLYLHVFFQQALMKNWARTDPNDPGSILKHGVPFDVMLKSYGSDDFEYLLTEESVTPGFIRVKSMVGEVLDVPAAVFDNSQKDHTSWVRDCADKPWAKWPTDKRTMLTQALQEPLQRIWESYINR